MVKSFVSGLVAEGPAPEHRDALMLYGQFVGNWMTETVEYALDGSEQTSTWDIRFQWVLEGRAVQDLWITPPRSSGSRVGWDAKGNRYSTTLRVYDPKIDAWHIIWTNPPTGTVVRQLGRRVGTEIIQLSELSSGGELTRWVYRDIQKDAFTWFNEVSRDHGATWRTAQIMKARRIE